MGIEGIDIREMAGGQISATNVEKVSGDKLCFIHIDSLGGSSKRPKGKDTRRDTKSIDTPETLPTSAVNVGTVTGGQVIGTQINKRRGDNISGHQVNVIKGPVTIYQPSAEADKCEQTIEEKVRLDVALPSSALVNEPFDLVIAVRQANAPVLTMDDLDQVASAEGSIFRRERSDVVKYRVEVTGAGFQVTPPCYVFQLHPGTNSIPIAFQVISSKTGKQSLFVNAYQEDGALVAQTRVRIQVAVQIADNR